MPTSGQPRLDASDIELGLRYVSECRVLIVADPLDEAGLTAAIDGAQYHRAQLVIAATMEPSSAANALPDHATVLAAPAGEDDGAFARLVGLYAAQLDAGRVAADAWRDALITTGWEAADEEVNAGVEP